MVDHTDKEQPTVYPLTFKGLQEANAERCSVWHKDGINEWTDGMPQMVIGETAKPMLRQ